MIDSNNRTVIVLCGPPGAGKTTEAHRLAKALDLAVFDRDEPQWASERDFAAALRAIGTDDDARAVVIRAGATADARRRTARMVGATEVKFLVVDEQTCMARVRRRPNPRRHIAAVRSWWSSFRRDGGASPSPGEDLLTARSSYHLSPRVLKPRKADRRTTTERGYGTEHQKLRKRLARTVDAGKARCVRCGQPILRGEPWDLGHVDHDRSRYAGPEHTRCNRATAGRMKRRPQPKWSRKWV